MSEQVGPVGHHSDLTETIPDYLLEIPQEKKRQADIDIIVEAKLKEQAIFKLYEKYPQFKCKKKLVLRLKRNHRGRWYNQNKIIIMNQK